MTKCPTCGGSGEVAHTVPLPGHALATTVTRYDLCPDCNVECRTCGGAGYCVDSLTFPPEQIGQPCPDCTPSCACYTYHEPMSGSCPLNVEPPFRANPNITWDQMPWELRPKNKEQ